jgi:hypothetical protein
MGGRGTRQEEYQFSTDTKNTENQFYLMVRPSKVVMCGTPFSPNLAARTLQSLYCKQDMEMTRGRRSKGPSSLLLKWTLPTALHNGAHHEPTSVANWIHVEVDTVHSWKFLLLELSLLMILLELFEDFFMYFPINFRCLHISQYIFIIPF